MDRTAVHRTKIMLPLGRMHKTPSGPFKAGTALNLDHEEGPRRAEEPLLGLCWEQWGGNVVKSIKEELHYF